MPAAWQSQFRAWQSQFRGILGENMRYWCV